MDTWSLPKTRPISCNDCPAFQRLHISVLCIAESFTRLRCVINTTFREKIYSRWCCIDRLSWHLLSECGFPAHVADSHIPIRPFIRTWPDSAQKNERVSRYQAVIIRRTISCWQCVVFRVL